MAKNRTIQRTSGKKKGRPAIRFNFGILIVIFVLSFTSCFLLYMAAANINDDFLDSESKTVVVKNEQNEETPTSDDDETEEPEDNAPAPPANPIPQSEAVDPSYFDGCCLVTDSTLLDISSYTDFKDVIGSNELGAANCNSLSIESSYGTVTIYQTMQYKKPTSLYLMLGSDIGTETVEDMIKNYTKLVSDLHSFLPQMKIYIMQLPPVAADTETITNALINDYNTRLLTIARNAGVYCIDTNAALKSSDKLASEYWNDDKSQFTAKAYQTIADYIRTHTV